MNPFQNVSFDTVEEMLEYLPPEERKVVEHLRQMVVDCLPDAKEKLAYNVPFYYRHARICFIWPGSVPWGGTKSGVVFGFCKAHLLSDVSYLDVGRRKNVSTRTFFKIKDIDREKLNQLLYEAMWIDEKEKKSKRKKV